MMIFNLVAGVVMTLSLIALMNATVRDSRVRARARRAQNHHGQR